MGRSLTVVDRPADIIYLRKTPQRIGVAVHRPGDLRYAGICSGSPAAPYSYWQANDIGRPQDRYSSLHMEGGNLVFVDGHAKYRKAKALRSVDFGLVPGDHDGTAPSASCYGPAF